MSTNAIVGEYYLLTWSNNGRGMTSLSGGSSVFEKAFGPYTHDYSAYFHIAIIKATSTTITFASVTNGNPAPSWYRLTSK